MKNIGFEIGVPKTVEETKAKDSCRQRIGKTLPQFSSFNFRPLLLTSGLSVAFYLLISLGQNWYDHRNNVASAIKMSDARVFYNLCIDADIPATTCKFKLYDQYKILTEDFN